MQIMFATPDKARSMVEDLAVLKGSSAIGALSELAARSGMEAALRAYEAGLNTPMIREPGL